MQLHRNVRRLGRRFRVISGFDYRDGRSEDPANTFPRVPALNGAALFVVPAILGWAALLDWAIGLPAW